LLLAGALVATSCQPILPEVGVDGAAGDLIIVVTASLNREARSVSAGVGGQHVASLSDDEEAFVFALDPSTLVTPVGTPIPIDEIEFRLVGESAPAQSCDRCIAPTAYPPRLMQPGESCGLPQWTRLIEVIRTQPQRLAVDELRLERLRQSVRIDRKGACGCEAHDSTPTSRIDVRLEAVREDPWPTRVFAQAPDGSVAVFAERIAVLIRPDGTRVVREPDGGLPICREPSELLPFAGPVNGAVALPTGGFLVASESMSDKATDLWVLDAELRPKVDEMGNVRALDLGLSERFHTLKMTTAGDRLVLAGRLIRAMSSMVLCDLPTVDSTFVDCDPFTDAATGRGFRWVGASARAALAVDSDVAVALARRPDDGSTPWPVEHFEIREIPVSMSLRGSETARDEAAPKSLVEHFGPAVALQRMWRSTVIDDRAFLCGALKDSTRMFIATATVAPMPSWSVVYIGDEYQFCEGFAAVTATSSTQRAAVRGSTGDWYLDVHADGRVGQATRYDRSITKMRVSVFSLEHGAEGWVLATSVDGEAFRARGGFADFEQVWGARSYEFDHFWRAVAADGDRFVVFGSLPKMMIVEGGTKRTVDLPEFTDLDIPASAVGASGGVVMVAGRRRILVPGGPTRDEFWIRRVQVDTGASVELARSSTVAYIDLAPVAPDVFVVTDDRGNLYVLRDDTLTDVEIDWDDPTTAELEERPRTPNGCSERSPSIPPRPTDLGTDDIFRAVDGAGGFAWVVGCQSAIVRVHAFSDPPRATRVLAERFDGWPLASPSVPLFSAVRTFCADDVVIASRQTGALARVWSMAAAPETGAPWTAYRPHEGFEAPHIDRGRPLDLVGAPGSLTAVMNTSVYRFDAQRRDRYEQQLNAAAQLDSGELLVVADYGRMLHGYVCE